ncbi:MAG: hypothetical protein J6S98_10065 [Lentisphaeria bacterium]|nr:hypothetical protein [Lentisphaeria bacterium]
MVFSSSIFLFAFLPLVLLLYFNPLNRVSGATKFFVLCTAGMLGIMYFSPEDIPVSWIFYGAVALFGLYLCKDWINRIWNSTERAARNLVITRNYPYATGSRCKQPQKPAVDRVRAKACFPLCGLGAEW